MIVDANILLYTVDDSSPFHEPSREWLDADPAWIPEATSQHATALRQLIINGDLRGNLVTDAYLAALAIEHGVGVCSADSDFARFPEIRWINPLHVEKSDKA